MKFFFCKYNHKEGLDDDDDGGGNLGRPMMQSLLQRRIVQKSHCTKWDASHNNLEM